MTYKEIEFEKRRLKKELNEKRTLFRKEEAKIRKQIAKLDNEQHDMVNQKLFDVVVEW